MREGVRGVIELPGDDAARVFRAQGLRLRDRAAHALGPGREDDLGAVGRDELDALDAHGVRHDYHGPVAQRGGEGGEADAGVAAGGLDYHAAGREGALRLGAAYHVERGAVLRAAGGIVPLELREHVQARGRSGESRTSGVEPMSPVISS